MNLAQLRAFDTVVRTGSITEAARRLYVTQPAVTSHIKALESTYDVALLRRQGRGGRADRARPLPSPPSPASCSRSKTARWSCSAPTSTSPGASCASPPTDPTSRCRWWRSSGAASRECGYRWRSRAPRGYRRFSRAEQCDVSIQGSLAEDRGLHVVDLTEFDIIAFVNGEHPWARAGRETVPLPEMDGRPVIAAKRVRRCGSASTQPAPRRGIKPEYFIETTSRETVKEAVAAGLGIGLISEAELRPDPRLWPVRLTGTDLRYTERVVCLERRRTLAVIREFLRVAEETGGRG